VVEHIGGRSLRKRIKLKKGGSQVRIIGWGKKIGCRSREVKGGQQREVVSGKLTHGELGQRSVLGTAGKRNSRTDLHPAKVSASHYAEEPLDLEGKR